MSNTDGSDLVQDITKLALSDNFYTWFTTTNQIIDAINPLNIYDITPRKGLNETRSGGNVILDVETGKGLKAYPNDAIGALTLDIENLTSESSVSNLDYFVIEKPGTEPSNDLFKVLASNILPPTLSGNHEFTGTITVNALNVKDNALRLQYDDATTDNDSGLILDTTSSSKVKFTYNTTKSAWFSNRNIGLQDGYAFLTNGTGRRAEFKYTTSGSTQYDVALEMFMGVDSTNNDDKSWIIEARNVDRALNFIYKDYTNTDTETRVFYATVETTNPVTSTFVVTDKIQIGNVLGSTTNFKTVTDYSTSIIPISNSNGILDSKWTNRYITSNYSAGLEVGNVVKIYNDTNNQATVVKCSLTSSSEESEAYSIGIVERISGGKIWVVTHGEFVLSNIPGSYSNLDVGAVYYLTSGSPNYTLTKPASGIVKPVFVATSTTGGIFFPVSAQGLSFGRFNAVASSGGTLVSGAEVTADAPNDVFTIDAGSGITLQTVPGSNKIVISASTLGNQPTYSTISTDSGGSVSAFYPSETLLLTGNGGGIEVVADNKVDTNGDKITIKGKYFRTVSWIGDSSTNDIPGSKTATYDDNLQIYAGTGIGIREYLGVGGGLLIEATGQSVASVSNGSITITKLATFNPNSVLIGNSSGTPTLQVTTNNSILSANSSGVISWDTPTTLLQDKFAKTGFDTGYPTAKQNNFGITPTRNFGIVRIPRNATTIGTTQDYEIPAFRFTTTNSINGALIGLQEGDGIELAVNNTVADIISGIPSIKITNKYGSAFSKVYIADTGETIESNGTSTVTYSNYFLNSNVMTSITWLRYRDGQAADSSIGAATTNIAGKETESSITFTDGIITSTTGTKVTFVNNSSLTSNLNNGIFANFCKPGTSTNWNATETEGKYLTISVYVATLSGTQSFKIGYYHGKKAGFVNTAAPTYSPDFTATTTPQRFTFTVKAQPSTTVSASTTEIPPNINISQPFGTINGGSVVVWGAQVEEGRTANSLISTTSTALSVTRIETQSHGTLRFDTTSSPILLDSDTNSDTIYFKIATNGITNNYLATMADNTVKVGTGSTNSDNTPQDLSIGTNSVLGRVGNGDLKSVSASELATMIGANYFTSIETDAGTVTPSETNIIKLKGGSGITVTESTDHQIIITNTGGTGGTGSISLVGDWDGTRTNSSASSKEKLLFSDGDLEYTISSLDNFTALISSSIRWSGLTSTINGGAGFLYGFGTATVNKDAIVSKFVPVNASSGSQLPVIDAATGNLTYVNSFGAGSTAITHVVGLTGGGTLVATSNFISTLSFTNISNLSFSGTTITASTAAATTFPIIASNGGVYTNGNANIGISMPTGSSSLHLGRDTVLVSTWSGGDFITQLGLGGSGFTVASGVTAPPSSTIKTRFFGSSAWANLSAASSPRICMPNFLIGTGPDSNSDTLGNGVYLRNDTTNNGLIFTNYNLSTNTGKTIQKDRSCRLGLEVLDVDTGTTAYANSKNTAYLTHTFIPRATSATTVDQFLIPNNSKKSYKYFIHVENASGDFYTTELLIQVKGTTTNIVQYASSSTSTSLSVNFSISATAGGSETTVTLTHSNTPGSLDIKLLKYEV
jgi:hypothetical protein